MPRLVIRKGVAAGRDHALGGECVVGRHPQVTFVLDDHLVSRRHFRVFQQGGVWLVEDLGSTNGILVNGRRTARQPLVDGDLIRAGSTEIQFVQKDLLAGGPRATGQATAPKPRRGPVDAPVARRHRRR
jgi:pSer/pThr/pTyr-binding forkhead associated (FHA) protein